MSTENNKRKTKYVFVTGGVTSSLGKGILSASLAKLLQARGLSVTIQKFDPYINIDPGTMNPFEHGECYVTDDGAETDLDLGHYERFLNIRMSQANNVTTGIIYQTVINSERRGDYLGKTIQVIPHITDEIKRRFKLLDVENNYDIIITEIGGTVGDIESLPYVEAVRQMKWELGSSNCLVIHLTLIPYLSAAGELKTKPTQHSVKTLLESGVQPDILVCRTERPLTREIRQKLALFCNVKVNAVIESLDCSTIYDVPVRMMKENLDKIVLSKLKVVSNKEPDITKWRNFLNSIKNPTREVNIGLIGKYTDLPDAYKSINESFVHAGAANECHVNIEYIASDHLNEENIKAKLYDKDAILVAPGFGERGIDGKLLAVKYVRENKVPFFGICLGMQCAVIEYARNVAGIKNANSTEFNKKTKEPLIDLMQDQKKLAVKGGTMRLGAYDCVLNKGSKVNLIYGTTEISERHRHRYEFNNKYKKILDDKGLKATGINPVSQLVEVVELKNHPWFIGTQYHPELKSTVLNPHPLFVSFVDAAIKFKLKQQKENNIENIIYQK